MDEYEERSIRDFDKREKEKKDRKKQLQRITVIIVIIAVAAVIVALIVSGAFKAILKKTGIIESEYAVIQESIDVPLQNDNKMTSCGDLFLIYDEKKGLTGFDTHGNYLWNRTEKYKKPVFHSFEDCVIVTDEESEKVNAYGKAGLLWTESCSGPVNSVFVHRNTAFATFISGHDSYKSEVFLYDTAKQKGVFVKDFGRYYIMSAAVSPDKSQMALSGYSSENGSGIIIFLNVNTGAEYCKEEFENDIFPYIEYADANTLVAANSDSLVKLVRNPSVSMGNDSKEILWERSASDRVLQSVSCLQNGVICASVTGKDIASASSQITVFDADGKQLLSESINERIAGSVCLKNSIAVYTGTSVYFIGEDGKIMCVSDGMSDIQYVNTAGNRSALVVMQTREVLLKIEEK